MAGATSLPEFVTLGQELYTLCNPLSANVVSQVIPTFLSRLQTCGLHRTHTVATTALSDIKSIPYYIRSGVVNPHFQSQLRASMLAINAALYSEISEQVTIAVNTGVVGQQLRNLPKIVNLTTTQTDLLLETITCIECGAYRAGAVMGWNLTYDFIRQWIFDNHLQQFNDTLLTIALKKDGTPVYERISSYDDFFVGKPGERTVIDTCAAAGLISGKIKEDLCYYLRRRNNYAHATFASPTADQTNAYVQHLLDLITASPFK